MKSPYDAGHEFGHRMVERGPRAVGAMLTGIGLFCLLGNAALLYGAERYLPILLAAAFPTLLMGPYVMITGRMERTPDNPLWWKVGYYVLAGGGLALGIYVAFWVLG